MTIRSNCVLKIQQPFNAERKELLHHYQLFKVEKLTFWSENVNFVIYGNGDWCFYLELSNVTYLIKRFTSNKV